MKKEGDSASTLIDEESSSSYVVVQRLISVLDLQMTMAVSKLSYVTAVAIERGKTNGELKEAKEEYSNAKAAYLQFLNEQAADHLTEE